MNKTNMGNVVSLRAYKTLKECKRLFKGYGEKLLSIPKNELMAELDRYRVESQRFPDHILTLVKGEILMVHLKRVALTEELQGFASGEIARIKMAVKDRLQD